MSYINISVFLDFVRASQDEYSHYFDNDSPLSEALADAQAARKDKARKAMGEALEAVLGTHESQLKGCVQDLRQLRRQEKAKRKEITLRERAMAYAVETGNFVPLLTVLGYSYQLNFDSVEESQQFSTVPEDWTPKSK